MKSQRHEKILQIIGSRDVETQEALSALLREAGFPVTQATVSRDIRELRLIKVPAESGGSKYALSAHSREEAAQSRLASFLREVEARFDYAGNTVVIRCSPGTAPAVCSMLDRQSAELKIVGSIAGDDTIFILMKSEREAQRLCAQLSGRFV